MNHKAFWEKYIAIASEEESKQYLKNYVFSLPPTEMKKWLLGETQAIATDLKQQLNDPSVSEAWKMTLMQQLDAVPLASALRKVA